MLHSKEDLYSTPEYAQKLYDLSGSTYKKLVWFDHGKHSYIRINNTEKYDAAITEFLAELDAKKAEKTLETV
jgi:esterase/lipase